MSKEEEFTLAEKRAQRNRYGWRDDEVIFLDERKFNPNQPRDPEGQWSNGGGVGLLSKASAHIGTIVAKTRSDGGSSTNVVTGKSPESGFMVAQKDGGIILSADDFYGENGESYLDEYVKSFPEFQNSDIYLGTWHDAESGKVFLDVAHNVQDRQEAIALAQENDQIAIWDVSNSKEVNTGGTGGLKSATMNYLAQRWLQRGK